MRKYIVVLFVLLLAGCTECRLNAPAKCMKLLSRHISVEDGITTIATGYGTAFVVSLDDKPYLVTAAHVTQTGHQIDIPFDIVGPCITYEDAIFIPIDRGKGLPIGYALKGDAVVAVGYPGLSQHQRRLRGRVTQQGYMTGLVEEGMSGGPVFNTNGEVIGVISAYLPNVGVSKYTLIPSSLEQ